MGYLGFGPRMSFLLTQVYPGTDYSERIYAILYLVVSHGEMDGYSFFNLIRASAQRNCQSTVASA